MEVKRKYMSKSHWSRVCNREYSITNFEENNLKGKASLLWLKNVTTPCFKNYENKSIKIIDNNYFWLQIGIENTNFWITAMYNEKQQNIQYYIDITQKNYIENEPDPYFDDLFLDVVLFDNELIILDEDELNQAFQENIINKKDVELAYNTAAEIKNKNFFSKTNLDNICNKYFEILYKKMMNK